MPPYARRTTRARRRRAPIRRRKATRSRRTTTQSMKRIAKSVTLRLCETKRHAVINENATPTPLNGNVTQWSFRPVFVYPQFQGSTSYEVIGSEILNPLMKCKFFWFIPWSSIIGTTGADVGRYATVAMHVYLIASNDQATNATFTNYSQQTGTSNQFNWFYQQDGYMPTFNGNNVKVLKKWSKLIHPDQIATTNTPIGNLVIPGRLSYRWKRKLTFEDSGTVPGTGGPQSLRVLRGWNYYLVTGFRVAGTSLANAPIPGAYPNCVLDTFLYYKDP